MMPVLAKHALTGSEWKTYLGSVTSLPVYHQQGITVICGDAREVTARLRNDSIDLVVTDPPYGHNNNNNNGDLIHRREDALGVGTTTQEDSRPISNDGEEEANELVQWLFQESARILAPGACCCCCCGGGPDPQFARWSLWMDQALQFKQMVIFDKGPMGMGWQFRRSYETVLVAQRPGASCRWFDTTDKIENIIRPGDYGIRKIIPSATEHPTAKPVALLEHFISLHTRPGDLVVDPFCGGGSTLIAAYRTGRRCLGIELEKQWYDYSVARLKDYIALETKVLECLKNSGSEGVLLNGLAILSGTTESKVKKLVEYLLSKNRVAVVTPAKGPLRYKLSEG